MQKDPLDPEGRTQERVNILSRTDSKACFSGSHSPNTLLLSKSVRHNIQAEVCLRILRVYL